ncbi:MAG: Asp-tRNA(Asn)/Glu-tRNA(Gln) amidotransferase subunit GatC [Patescibacteria group bacterium]
MLTPKELDHIALLSRLQLSEDEQTQFVQQLSDILQFVEQVQTVETKDIEPLHHVTGLETVWRDDEPRAWPHRDELIESAPRHSGDHIETESIF